MRSSQRAIVSLAALGLTVLASGSAFAAPTLNEASRGAYPGEAYSQYKARGGVVRAGGYRGGHHGGYYRGGRGVGGAAAGIGLAAGLLGAAIVASQPAPAPVYAARGPGWNRYCFRRFGPTFDPGSGTYMGADGYRYPCQ